jgi:hypothetical protein
MSTPQFEERIMISKYVGLIAGLLLPIAAVFAGVNFDYDKTVDFSTFRTYSMGKMTELSSQLQQQRLEQAIEEQLNAKGLTKKDSGGDLLVQIHAASKDKQRITADTMGAAPGWGGWGRFGGFGGMGTTMVNVQNITEGQLTIDLVKSDDNQLVWRAIVSDYLSDKPDKVAKSIQKGVAKAFKHYPPDGD